MSDVHETIRQLRRQVGELTKRAGMEEARNALLREALKGVPIFEYNGYSKTCVACGAKHFFNEGPPVTIHHKPGCWGGAILAALAANAESEGR